MRNLGRACLGDVIELEARRALHIKISSVAERVVRADENLVSNLPFSLIYLPDLLIGSKLTGWLLPGSFTVASCSSLYFSKAGVSSETIFGEDTVKALMSATVS